MKFLFTLFPLICLGLALKVDAQDLTLIREKYNSKNLKTEYYVLKHNRQIKQGDYTSYWYGNIIKETGKYQDNLKDGEWNLYDKNGRLTDVQYYEKGAKTGVWLKIVASGQVVKRFDHTNNVALEPIIKAWCKYPAIARENQIEGIVKVEYLLNSTCDISRITVVQSVHESLDKSAVEGTREMLKLMNQYKTSACDSIPASIEVVFSLDNQISIQTN